MTKTKPFAQLVAPARADPVRRARVAAYERAIEDALTLAALRAKRRLTQRQVARTLRVSQARVSRIEHEEDVYLSTLRNYVAALGGQLEVKAVFPDRTITLTTHRQAPAADDVDASPSVTDPPPTSQRARRSPRDQEG